jgi:protein-disulfide isomerase
MIRQAAMALALLLALPAMPVRAADVPLSEAQIDALIKRLDASGLLDAVVDRVLRRYVERREQAVKEQQEEQQRQQVAAAANARAVDIARDHVFGNPQSEVSLIVYSDLECPYCKRFAGTPEQAIVKFNGKANVVFRHFPLETHGDMALRGARVAECVGRQAGSRAFFGFANQWMKVTGSNGAGPERGEAGIRELAQEAGVKDLAALGACVDDPATGQKVLADVEDGMRSGISGTPGVIVRNNHNGRSMPLAGAVPAEVLEQLIEEALTR